MVEQATPAAPAVYQLATASEEPESARAPSLDARTWIEPLLWRNAVWFTQLRWIVVGVLATVGLAGLFSETLVRLGLNLRPAWPFVSAAILTFTNGVFIRLARTRSGAAPAVPVRVQLWSQIVTDLLVLTVVIHWLGSDLPFAPLMYLFHVVLACIVFPPSESLVVAALAAGLYLLCLWLESLGVAIPTSILAHRAGSEPWLGADPARTLNLASLFLIWAVIWYLVSRLAGTLLERERQLALTNRQLEASSEERAIHMLQTTHQLKAPFAAIHAHAQLLLGGYCGTLPAAARGVVEKIASRCAALSRQIQEMLQLANLRSVGQTAPACTELNLATLIETAIQRAEPAARQRDIRFEKSLEPVTLMAVADHWTMLLDNLIGNAVAYSREHGLVSVQCQAQSAGLVRLTICDRGIGIPAGKLARVFDDYYRTEEAVQHNPMSTGLGLAIVRDVARKANLSISVESAPGWGTCFTVTIPHAHRTVPAAAQPS